MRRANLALDDGDTLAAASMLATANELAGALGLELHAGTGDDAEIDALVRERDTARATRDFATADRIRDALAARGVQLEDTPAGTIWHR